MLLIGMQLLCFFSSVYKNLYVYFKLPIEAICAMVVLETVVNTVEVPVRKLYPIHPANISATGMSLQSGG